MRGGEKIKGHSKGVGSMIEILTHRFHISNRTDMVSIMILRLE